MCVCVCVCHLASYRKVFPGTLTSHITLGENTVIMVAGLERQVLPVSVLRPPLSTPPTLMTPPTISSSQSNGVIPQRTTVPLTPAAVTHGLTQLKMGVRGVVRKNSAIEDNSSGELWRTKRIKLDSETESLAVSTDAKLSPATLIADSRTTSTLLVPGTQHEPTATHSRLNLSHRASRSPSEPTSSGDQLRGNSPSTRDNTPLSASSSSQQLSQRSSPVSSLTSSSSSHSPSREIMNPSLLLSGSMNITSSTVVCNIECQWSTCTKSVSSLLILLMNLCDFCLSLPCTHTQSPHFLGLTLLPCGVRPCSNLVLLPCCVSVEELYQ